MNISNDKSFYAYLSLYSNFPHWKLSLCKDEEYKYYELPVGAVVYYVLNRINRIKDDGQIDFLKYFEKIEQEIEEYKYNKESWSIYYDELMYLIEHKSDIPSSEKYRMYRIYSQFAYFFLNNFDFDEWIAFAENCDTPDILINSDNLLNDVIQWGGYRNDESGMLYVSYKCSGFESFFMLDLWELLYNPNMDLVVKQCKHCGDFFFTKINQQKYCFDCKEPMQYNKIRNEVQKKDEAKRLCKKICDILYKRDENGVEYLAFLSENQYHKDRLKGKFVEAKPNYQDISTEIEYIEWLAEYHEKIKLR